MLRCRKTIADQPCNGDKEHNPGYSPEISLLAINDVVGAECTTTTICSTM
jgi:hypothetical protein